MPTGAPPTPDEATALSAIALAWDLQWNSLAEKERRTFKAQQRALASYEENHVGTLAAQAANVHRRTFERWVERNHLRFRERLAESDAAFVGSVEKSMLDHMAANRQGTHILYMFVLKAHAPGVYRELPAMDDEVAKETLSQLRKLSKKAHSTKGL